MIETGEAENIFQKAMMEQVRGDCAVELHASLVMHSMCFMHQLHAVAWP